MSVPKPAALMPLLPLVFEPFLIKWLQPFALSRCQDFGCLHAKYRLASVNYVTRRITSNVTKNGSHFPALQKSPGMTMKNNNERQMRSDHPPKWRNAAEEINYGRRAITGL